MVEILKLRRIVSYTTRPQRPHEINGKEYYFISELTLRTMMKQDPSLVKTANNIHGHIYARTEKDIENIIAQNLHGVIVLYVDIVAEWRVRFGKNAICIFLKPPSLEVLKKRLQERGDDAKIIQQRIQNAAREIVLVETEYKSIFDYILTLPDNKQEATQKIIDLFKPLLI